MDSATWNDGRALPSLTSEADLDELLSRPRDCLIESIRQLRSPLVVLGASGKMGPSLCMSAKRAAEMAGSNLKVLAVSRFSARGSRDWFHARGIETVSCDLLNRPEVEKLPDSENVVYLVGLKFGTRQNPALTWAVNTLVPSHVAERYAASQIVALSTGNVYPLVPVASGGATETTPPAPVGEYGSAALARERIFDYYSQRQGTRIVLLRLNYAVELRYGVLVDIAQKVWNNEVLDLAAGHLNCIWQRDANEIILRSFPLSSAPASVFNLTGAETLSVRQLAEQIGRRMARTPRLAGKEGDTALLNDASLLQTKLGPPSTPLEAILDWTAHWVMERRATLGKPTHFEVRSGEF